MLYSATLVGDLLQRRVVPACTRAEDRAQVRTASDREVLSSAWRVGGGPEGGDALV